MVSSEDCLQKYCRTAARVMSSESTVSLQRMSYVSSARVRKCFVLGELGVGVSTEEEDAELAVLDSFSNFSSTWNVMSSSPS